VHGRADRHCSPTASFRRVQGGSESGIVRYFPRTDSERQPNPWRRNRGISPLHTPSPGQILWVEDPSPDQHHSMRNRGSLALPAKALQRRLAAAARGSLIWPGETTVDVRWSAVIRVELSTFAAQKRWMSNKMPIRNERGRRFQVEVSAAQRRGSHFVSWLHDPSPAADRCFRVHPQIRGSTLACRLALRGIN
jgi:hypothetical protein